MRFFRIAVVLILCGCGLHLGLADTVTSGATLAEMKEAWATLMGERAELASRARESARLITTSRSTTGRGGGAGTESARAYREAAMRVEKALDEHPQIKQLQEQYDAAQAEKLEISREQAKVLDAWREAKKAPSQRLQSGLAEANKRAEEARDALMKTAGVKDVAELNDAQQERLRAIHGRLTNEVAAVNAAYAQETAAPDPSEAGAKNEFAMQFEQINTQYREIEETQAGLKAAMLRLRQTLRKDDPAVAQLQQAASEASQKHVADMDARPEAAGAREFLASVDTMRAEIDRQARSLRKAILTVDPGCKPELDKQAAAGGLALVGEDFWKL